MLGGTPGAERAQERDWGRGRALEDSSSHWLARGLNEGGAWLWQAAHMAGHVRAESAPGSPAPGFGGSPRCD